RGARTGACQASGGGVGGPGIAARRGELASSVALLSARRVTSDATPRTGRLTPTGPVRPDPPAEGVFTAGQASHFRDGVSGFRALFAVPQFFSSCALRAFLPHPPAGSSLYSLSLAPLAGPQAAIVAA